jgi:cyclic beta-1,2-glucan synthetase
MLASESRLASFIAIANGDVVQEHWFRLGRQLTAVGGSQALISWTASMFEYLMPLLVMRSFEKTLLHQTYHAVVARQIEYGKARQHTHIYTHTHTLPLPLPPGVPLRPSSQ